MLTFTLIIKMYNTLNCLRPLHKLFSFCVAGAIVLSLNVSIDSRFSVTKMAECWLYDKTHARIPGLSYTHVKIRYLYTHMLRVFITLLPVWGYDPLQAGDPRGSQQGVRTAF